MENSVNLLKQDLDRQKREYRKYFLNYMQFIGEKIETLTSPEAENFLHTELDDIKTEYEELISRKELFKCAGCGVCCKFAVSEFSPAQLEQKARNGDNYARQFTSVFIPYTSVEEAAAVFGEYVELLKETDGYYIYHCPKVTKDNRCPDYENRPQICRDFPDNPLAVLPFTCGYNMWRNQIKSKSLELEAKQRIVEFYLSEINNGNKI